MSKHSDRQLQRDIKRVAKMRGLDPVEMAHRHWHWEQRATADAVRRERPLWSERVVVYETFPIGCGARCIYRRLLPGLTVWRYDQVSAGFLYRFKRSVLQVRYQKWPRKRVWRERWSIHWRTLKGGPPRGYAP